MKKRFLFILFVSLLLGDSLYAQKQGQELIDSLHIELRNTKQDTNKVNVLNMMCREVGLTISEYDTAYYYANEALKLAKMLNYNKGKSTAYHYIGIMYSSIGNYPDALKNHLASLKIKEELGDKRGISNSYHNIGLNYYYQGNYQETLKNYFASLKMRQELDDQRGIAASYNNIGNVYSNQGNYPEALKNHLAALKIREELGYKVGIAASYNNIGGVYYHQKNYSEALKNHFAALKIREEIGDKSGIASSHNNIGIVYDDQGNIQEALKNYFAALTIREEIGDISGIISAHNNIGVVYTSKREYTKSLDYLFRALELSENIGDILQASYANLNIGNVYKTIFKDTTLGMPIEDYLAMLPTNASVSPTDKRGLISAAIIYYEKTAKEFKALEALNDYKDAQFNLAEAYELKGDYARALAAYKEHTTYKDSIFNEENTIKLTRLEVQYEADKRQDSLRFVAQQEQLALQKEIQLAALKHKYERKQAIAKSEEERRQLLLEEEYKRQQIENEYAAARKELANDFEKQQVIERVENEKKEALAQAEIKRYKHFRNLLMVGVGLALALLFFVYRNYRNQKRNNHIITSANATISAEKKRSDELLKNILPVEVAEELKATGTSEARHYENVTVLFTDFVDFTKKSSQYQPQFMLQELNECFTAFDNIIERNGLEKIKTIGDAYLAVCGLPVSDSEHAKKTVRAALEIRDFIALRKQKEDALDIRIGIHSGSVVAGIVGVKKFAYDIWGDTVNTAARMESSGEAGKVNISEMTYQLVINDFICEYRGEIEAKGKGAVDMYFVEKIDSNHI